METFSISPFDIPLIVDLIGQHLSKRDVINCSLVNKLFHEQFKRWCWRSFRAKLFVDLYVPEPVPVPLDLELQKALLKNKSFIRKLDVWESEEGELLKFIADTLSPRSLISLSYVAVDNMQDGYLQLLMDLVERNSALQSLRIDFVEAEDRNIFSVRFINAISNLPLTTLKLREGVIVHRNDYRALLQRLPITLQTFEIGWCIEENRGVDEVGHFPDIGFRHVYPHLTALSMDLQLEHEDTILFPFLRRCPALETFKIVQSDGDLVERLSPLLADAALFPKLTNITLDVDPSTGFSDLLPAMHGHIKKFSCSELHSLGVEALTNHWGSTLEVLRIGPFSYTGSEGVKLILTTCSRLRVLTVFSDIGGDKDGYTNERAGYWAWSYREYNHDMADWNCLDLEHLELTFLDFRGVGSGSHHHRLISSFNSSQLELHTFTGIHRVCYQLGRLTKLRHLRLGWSTGREVQSGINLDMSISNGLMHLEGLEELEVLDVTCIEHVDIEQREVEWMAVNWPKLQRIKGLFKKDYPYYRWLRHSGDVDDEDTNHEKRDESNDPKPIQWLRSQRPHLVIS
ncbi:hypothetical protein BGX26_009543 [Mortierella sp. AD094]|nr:hypothetical protein BGX26_009543 [Mortierella sp. AD094]